MYASTNGNSTWIVVKIGDITWIQVNILLEFILPSRSVKASHETQEWNLLQVEMGISEMQCEVLEWNINVL